MKIVVYVTPKKNMLNPQGDAVAHAMESLGYPSVANVRVGKTITFEMEGEDTPEWRQSVDQLCVDLLSNPVIEDYSFQVT